MLRRLAVCRFYGVSHRNFENAFLKYSLAFFRKGNNDNKIMRFSFTMTHEKYRSVLVTMYRLFLCKCRFYRIYCFPNIIEKYLAVNF